jgi:hypothetical protein
MSVTTCWTPLVAHSAWARSIGERYAQRRCCVSRDSALPSTPGKSPKRQVRIWLEWIRIDINALLSQHQVRSRRHRSYPCFLSSDFRTSRNSPPTNCSRNCRCEFPKVPQHSNKPGFLSC